jgi:hypothetical protein
MELNTLVAEIFSGAANAAVSCVEAEITFSGNDKTAIAVRSNSVREINLLIIGFNKIAVRSLQRRKKSPVERRKNDNSKPKVVERIVLRSCLNKSKTY